MQELNFEQVSIVGGGSRIEDRERESAAREALERSIEEAAGGPSSHWTSNNNNLFSTVVRNAGIGAIGGALGGPWGAAGGAAVGAMVGASQYYGNK